MLSGSANTKAWLDHLKVATPYQPSNAASPTIEINASQCRADAVKATEARTCARGTTIHLHASCSVVAKDSPENTCTCSASQKAASEEPAATAPRVAAVPRTDTAHTAAAADAAQQGSLHKHACMEAREPTVQLQNSVDAEKLDTQLLQSLGHLQQSTVKAAHLAVCSDLHLPICATETGDKATSDRLGKAASQQQPQGNKRHKPDPSLSRELRALKADGCFLDNQSSRPLDPKVTTRSTAVLARKPQETTAGQSPSSAQQIEQRQGTWKQQRSRFSTSKTAPVAFAGQSADTGDIEAIRRYSFSACKQNAC